MHQFIDESPGIPASLADDRINPRLRLVRDRLAEFAGLDVTELCRPLTKEEIMNHGAPRSRIRWSGYYVAARLGFSHREIARAFGQKGERTAGRASDHIKVIMAATVESLSKEEAAIRTLTLKLCAEFGIQIE